MRDAVRLGSPREDVTDDEVWAALRSAHAAQMVEAMPGGLDQQLGEQWGGVGISGGQWQRLALARIYLRDSPIWILDEPTSAIDAEAEQEVFHELQRTKQGRITVVVSHRAWTLKDMDRIYVFDDGRIVEQGRYEELLALQGRFAEIFAEQSWPGESSPRCGPVQGACRPGPCPSGTLSAATSPGWTGPPSAATRSRT